MRAFGLIGYPLTHSFSKSYFAEKFAKENLENLQYENYPIENMHQMSDLWKNNPQLEGLNITIPYKKAVIPYIDNPSSVVQDIQACNCIRKFENNFYGYNTDVIGFEKSLLPFLKPVHSHALILGTGGAAAAVEWVLKKINIPYRIVTRVLDKEMDLYKFISYEQLDASIIQAHKLIINTSPVGMFPLIDQAPVLPYEAISRDHHLFDLIYNPATTLFLQKGAAQGASTQNGLEMLHLQAAASWEIWNSPIPIVQ